MSDFAALLGQLQESAQSLSKSISDKTTNNKRDGEASNQPPSDRTKRARRAELDAKDFSPVDTIFILCPAGVQTGGPEALHQLCDILNETTNIKAYMLYVVPNNGSGVMFASRAKTPPPYRQYNAPAVSYDPLRQGGASQQQRQQLLIWPECWTNEMLQYLDTNNSNATPCAIWWLSVNNNTKRFKEWQRKDIVHLHQSEYAKQHLLQNGATHVWKMTEYISYSLDDVAKSNDSTDTSKAKETTAEEATITKVTENRDPSAKKPQRRKIDVLFNPLKGVHYTDEIRKRSGASIDFRPIGGGDGGRSRISSAEVQVLLTQATIYMDFGPHPGMDRLPREAALAGCLVVTNGEGAAHYQQDVPLPSKYKVRKFDPEAIHKLLKDLLEHVEERNDDLNEYRAWIRGQKEQMKECVTNLVSELVTKRTARSNGAS